MVDIGKCMCTQGFWVNAHSVILASAWWVLKVHVADIDILYIDVFHTREHVFFDVGMG